MGFALQTGRSVAEARREQAVAAARRLLEDEGRGRAVHAPDRG